MDTPSADDCHRQVAPGWRAHDLTPQDASPMIDRFIRHFEPGPNDQCWIWRGPVFNTGYGKLSRSSRHERSQHLLAHRLAWVAFTGKPLTGSITIDHLCNNKLCVNPGHLEPVSLHENIRRKNERLGYTIGATKRAPVSGRKRRPARPIVDEDDRAQRNRENALAYYRANRERILAERRSKPRLSPMAKCRDCDLELRRDGLRRHRKRKHGLV